MSSEIKIIQFDDALRNGFFDFAKLVHPKEKDLKERMQWFTFGNPLAQSKTNLPGLVTITTDNNELIGQFLMSPFEFHLRGKKHNGYFGYDFFVKEEFRSRGAGALLFMQGVRMYAPFIGVGLTQVVEKISKAAGMQTIGQLKKYIWVRSPVAFGGRLLRHRLMKSDEEDKTAGKDIFPDVVDATGMRFHRSSSLPEGLAPFCGEEVLEPDRSKDFLQWRFGQSPREYQVYLNQDQGASLFLVVRKAFYQGMTLLLIVDFRFPSGNWESMDTILRAAKTIATILNFDGVIMVSTLGKFEEAAGREHFRSVGRSSSVIAYLPSDEFSPAVNSACLTMADADLDFSFGEDP